MRNSKFKVDEKFEDVEVQKIIQINEDTFNLQIKQGEKERILGKFRGKTDMDDVLLSLTEVGDVVSFKLDSQWRGSGEDANYPRRHYLSYIENFTNKRLPENIIFSKEDC